MHVAGWAKRFLFDSGQLDRPISSLSGGEQARVLIARLMLQPADVLLLDEPTNDLDIPTLEVLEESLTDFPGGLVMVTHDRYLLDRISTAVLAWTARAARRCTPTTGSGSRPNWPKTGPPGEAGGGPQGNPRGNGEEEALVSGIARMGAHGSAHTRSRSRSRGYSPGDAIPASRLRWTTPGRLL